MCNCPFLCIYLMSVTIARNKATNGTQYNFNSRFVKNLLGTESVLGSNQILPSYKIMSISEFCMFDAYLFYGLLVLEMLCQTRSISILLYEKFSNQIRIGNCNWKHNLMSKSIQILHFSSLHYSRLFL